MQIVQFFVVGGVGVGGIIVDHRSTISSYVWLVRPYNVIAQLYS